MSGQSALSAGTDPAEFSYEVAADGGRLDVEMEIPDQGISDPFDPERIDVVTRNPTISLLLSRIRRGSIDLAPDFQRHAGIWRDVNQSRLIESILLRIPLPTFYAAEVDDEKWAIVDGIQRLTTIARFVDPDSIGLEPLVLRGLDYLKLDGTTFADLPGRLKTRLEETEVVLHLIRRGTPEEVKFNIFARINTGGMPLSQQELRHALIPGKARALLGELAESTEFTDVTLGSVAPGRMADREMVLRFLAFYSIEPSSYGSPDLDPFLRRKMEELNSMAGADFESISVDFKRAMRGAAEIFGQNAFRKQRSDKASRSPINKALFETVAVNLAHRSPEEVDALVRSKGAVNKEFIRLFADPEFDRAISVGTGAIARVRFRFAAVNEIFGRHDKVGAKHA